MSYFGKIFLAASICISASCKTGEATPRQPQVGDAQQSVEARVPQRVSRYTYEIINAYPHDVAAFTQGLVYYQGALYESTGLNGQSSLRKTELETGRVLMKFDVPSQFFGEGLALLNGRAYQLTWQSQQGFIYDLNTFQLINTFNYTGEGWGLTHDGKSLIMSDGSNQIRFLNPDNFQVQRVISVYEGSQPINQLNELEYIKGEIYANIWQSDRVACIDPKSGRVVAWLNLKGLLSDQDRTGNVDVLNGIAYDESGDRLFVTGKLWPKVFEIRLKTRPTLGSR